jgi:DNA (cytosine-5)-methyltransferase 1
MREKAFRTIDLFAGVGGIRLGFERAGFETVFANDYEPKCKDTYDLNFSNTPLTIEDLQKVEIDDLPDFDFLLGGFPCQPFSVAGYRQGFKDERGRGNLFFRTIDILKAKKPTGFLLENVKNLYTHDDGNTFRVISDELDKAGYRIEAKVLNSMEYGNVPQNRERVYIVGFLKETEYIYNFTFPEKTDLTVSISDILEDSENIAQKYYYNDKPLFEKIKEYPFEEGIVYQWRRKYVRENKSGVCPTLTANMGTGGHNVPLVKDDRGIRKLTPRECARLQGFPESYRLSHIADSALYKQFGNSVTVPVIEGIAKNIRKAVECRTHPRKASRATVFV